MNVMEVTWEKIVVGRAFPPAVRFRDCRGRQLMWSVASVYREPFDPQSRPVWRLFRTPRPRRELQDRPDFHRAFKAATSVKNMAMKELLEASFRCWVDLHGDDLIKSLLPPK
jgi:hypothetical protein